MSEDWLSDDPLIDPSDPAAVAREQRRREREARRREREAREDGEQQRQPPAPVATAKPSPPPPSASKPRRDPIFRRPSLKVVAVLAAMALAAFAVVALAYRYFDKEPPPPVVFKTTTVTIPEGLSRAQTAELTRELGLKGNYLQASRGREGFLFPDTFELRKGAPVSDLVQLQLEDFKGRIAGVDLSYARSKNLTLRDVVTIASMVEEEAMLDEERKLIAAVIYNRLRDGIPLGIDATIRFATGNYTQPLGEEELAVDSPYNTRLNAGLPPGPISSPGLASLEAAARPADVDYLYYVAKPGTCGEHAFSTSYDEFLRNADRYDEAREAAGGESPDSC